MIFDIVEYMIMERTKPNESSICRRVLILKKRRIVLLDSKSKQGRLWGRQVLLVDVKE